jgi:RNA:NAD 2'-phosphotransferase (TPT1/KptA family)
MNREVAVSKALSKLLRHAAEDEGLALDNEGFARLDQVVSFSVLQSLGNNCVNHSLSPAPLSFFPSANLQVIYIYHVDNHT